MQVLVKQFSPDKGTQYAGIKTGQRLELVRKDEERGVNPRTMYLVKSKTGKYITLYGSEVTVIEKLENEKSDS
jgi:hypothetical protein